MPLIGLIRRLSLSQWILVSMVIGLVWGWQFPESARELKVVSTLFLNLIKVIIVPLIVATLVVGIAGASQEMKTFGRLALKSFLYFMVVTTLALLIGMAAVNLTRPGEGVQLNTSAEPGKQFATTTINVEKILGHLVPQSISDAAARNDILQVVVFSVLFAVALGQVEGRRKEVMLEFFEGLAEVMFKFTRMVMWFAPFGVGAAMAHTIGQNGLGIVGSLGKLVLTLYGALLVFVMIVLVPVMWCSRISVRQFFSTLKRPALLAFSTASSEAALPDALRLMEQFGVPRRIVSFVLPTGYSFNLAGSTLYLAVASLFIAQAAGLELTLAQQWPIMFTLLLTSKGIAPVPRASLVILSGTLVSFGLPLEGVALLLGADAFMDMARTLVNFLGNCLAPAVVARWEGTLGKRDEEAPKQTEVVTG